MKIIEINPSIKHLVDANGGYCPCTLVKNEDTKCMCKEFKEQKRPGVCHCGRFEKVDVVKVVRCKDCTQCYHNPSLNTFRCGRFMAVVDPNHFCSCGERNSNDYPDRG